MRSGSTCSAPSSQDPVAFFTSSPGTESPFEKYSEDDVCFPPDTTNALSVWKNMGMCGSYEPEEKLYSLSQQYEGQP